MTRPICECKECSKEFTEDINECPDCGEDGRIDPIYYCPFCDVKMDYDWGDNEAVCPECDFTPNGVIEECLDFFKECLKYYDKRVGAAEAQYDKGFDEGHTAGMAEQCVECSRVDPLEKRVKVLKQALFLASWQPTYEGGLCQTPDVIKRRANDYIAQAEAELATQKDVKP